MGTLQIIKKKKWVDSVDCSRWEDSVIISAEGSITGVDHRTKSNRLLATVGALVTLSIPIYIFQLNSISFDVERRW